MYKKKVLSEEHKKKLSLAKLGKKQSPEQIKHRTDKLRGEQNFFWQGDKVKYRLLHAWVVRNYGQPTTCEHCQKTGLTGHKIHWANISHSHKRERTDWIRLCAKCHGLFDKQNGSRKHKHTTSLSSGEIHID